MAQNLEKKSFPNHQVHHRKESLTSGESRDTDESRLSQSKRSFFFESNSNASEELGHRFERIAPHRGSKSLATHPTFEGKSQVASQRYQPSKAFAQKCLTELESVLSSIKIDYHEEIKSLYTGEDSQQLKDLSIRVGEEFKQSVHKCIVASRAYKFFCTLKLFKVCEEHIIVSKIQEHKAEQQIDKTEELSLEELIADQLKEKQLKEALEQLECVLPENLVDLDTIRNFVRRTYFDLDLLDEEAQLNRKLVDWLKANRPELIKNNDSRVSRTQINHRESFRTIQPDLKKSSPIERTSSTSKQDSGIDSFSKMDSQQESIDETSQTASLTRAETFELLPNKAENNSPNCSPAPTGVSSTRSANEFSNDDDEFRKQLTNDSESSEAYAPVTRTGLRPKKFTTPVGLKASNRSGLASSPRASAENAPTNVVSKPKGVPVDRVRGFKKSGLAHKKSIETKPDVTEIAKSPTPASLKPVTSTPTDKIRTKPTVIARAHPISLERSQSPATSVFNSAKVKPKNFITANKKSVANIEKISSSLAAVSIKSDRIGTQGHHDNESEIETSDASYLAIEPLTSDNLAAQLDKFTVASCSKLADDLTKMFVGEILADSVITVSEAHKSIKAHKCILAARSAYLNDMINRQSLSSGSSESSSIQQTQYFKIDLSEFSYPVVYFSIMHIYSGIVKVPEDLDLEDLAKLTNTLHVGTLRQVCIHNLRMNYCHYFHKPCSICCIGVLRTLPIAWRYDYSELYSKCLQWIGSHFAQIFCLEEFSNLKPNDLIEECYKTTLSQLTPDNVIQKTIECQKLLKSLPRVKWTEPIICLVGRQLEDFCHYVADNYEKILNSESFLSLGKSCWECEVLEENLLAAMNHLKPDSGCKTLIQLDKIECAIEPFSSSISSSFDDTSSKNVSESFASLIAKMRKYCERYLLKEAAAVVHCSSWRQMHPTLQKRIKDQALLSTDFDEPTRNLAAKPRLPSVARQQSSRLSPSSPQPGGAKSPIIRASNDSPSRLKSPNAYLPTPKNKPAVARHVKVLK